MNNDLILAAIVGGTALVATTETVVGEFIRGQAAITLAHTINAIVGWLS